MKELFDGEYAIPKGYTASIENGKIIIKKEENVDERIRKAIIKHFKDGTGYLSFSGFSKEQIIAWLEKQCEQKPTLRIDNSRAKVVFPFKAKVKSTGIVVTIHDGQLSIDGKEWIKYQSDNEDGYEVYEPEDLEYVCNVEPKPAWSEEDESMLQNILECLKNGLRKLPTDVLKYESWLQSIKDRVQPQQQQEWGEEDEEEFNVMKSELEKYILLKQYGTPLSVHDIE